MQGRHYQWRLHPSPPSRIESYPSPKESAAIDHDGHNDNNVATCRNVSNTKYSFRLDDDVYIRPKSSKEIGISGRIIDILDVATTNGTTPDASPKRTKKRKLVEDIRVSVQQHRFDHAATDNNCGSGNTIKKSVRPSRLFPVYDIHNSKQKAQPLVILTPDTTNYRQLATSHLRSSDKVLEIGCSTGECTVLLARRLILHKKCLQQGQIVAFDTGADMIQQSRNRLLSEFTRLIPKDNNDCVQHIDDCYLRMVQFHKVDALADPKGAYSHAMRGSNRAPDMVLIDIGGNRELSGVVRMIQWVQEMFQNEPPRLIIVKSEALVDDLSRSVGSKENEVELEGDQSILGNKGVGMKTIHPSVTENGIIGQAQEWFSSLVPPSGDASRDAQCNSAKSTSMTKQSAPKYSHPFKAPLVLSPKDDATPICRFHNYHSEGCKRHNSNSENVCPYDHEHCHWCGEVGHVALNCPR